MAIDFNYQWFLVFCKEEGLPTDSLLVEEVIKNAKRQSIQMKKYMDMKNDYPDDELIQQRCDEQIKRLNDKRIEEMLFAVTCAEVSKDLGEDFDRWNRRQMEVIY